MTADTTLSNLGSLHRESDRRPPRHHTVVAVAGRRIDAEGATPARFPLSRVGTVRAALRAKLMELKPLAMVASAACGADLLALDVAGDMGVRRRVVLPFEPARFKVRSVIDRPAGPVGAEWSELFDRIIETVRATGDLVVLDDMSADEAAFAATNVRILQEAAALAATTEPVSRLMALVVWDGHRRDQGAADTTDAFRAAAVSRHFAIEEVLTV